VRYKDMRVIWKTGEGEGGPASSSSSFSATLEPRLGRRNVQALVYQTQCAQNIKQLKPRNLEWFFEDQIIAPVYTKMTAKRHINFPKLT
jgi:hypothetical protein